jgi:suppressor of G2 allele of SKP1
LCFSNPFVSITLHRLGRFTEAQTHLEQSKELNPTEKTLVTWLRKNTEKMPLVQENKPLEKKPEPTAQAPAPVAPKVTGR